MKTPLLMSRIPPLLLLVAFAETAGAFDVTNNPQTWSSRRSATTTATTANSSKWKSLAPSSTGGSRPRRHCPWQAADGNDNGSAFSEEEVQKMDDLILSLSLETQDDQRRDRVAQALGAKILEPNGLGSSERFMRLFEERLTIMGNAVRDKAASQAQDDQQGVMVPGQPSEAVGKQLWALVDIMIQSKVIFKQAKNDGMV